MASLVDDGDAVDVDVRDTGALLARIVHCGHVRDLGRVEQDQIGDVPDPDRRTADVRANRRSDSVTVFRLHEGLPRPTGAVIEVESPSCVLVV